VLATVPGLKVTARTSAFAYRARGMDVREIGSKLNVMYLLDGSVRKAGNRNRVTAQLVNAGDGYQMWSEHYDREMTDIFEIQDEIAQAIVGKLRIRLPGGAPRAKRYTENLEAYNQYLKARYLHYNRTAETLARSAELLRQALTIDPNYPLAHLGLAEHYTIAAHQGFKMPRELLPKAKAALERALELDATLAEAHALLGYIQACFEYDWVGGESQLKYALTLDPRSANCLYRYAFSMRGLSHRLDEALALARRAQDYEPRSVLVNWLPAYLLFFRSSTTKLSRSVFASSSGHRVRSRT
jgi:tetratricopeptide (TPR) repeat protein